MVAKSIVICNLEVRRLYLSRSVGILYCASSLDVKIAIRRNDHAEVVSIQIDDRLCLNGEFVIDCRIAVKRDIPAPCRIAMRGKCK